MGAPRDDDTDDMREARDKIVEIIRGFISDIQAEPMADPETNFTYETV